LPGDGGRPGQAYGLFGVQFSKLGHFDEKGECHDFGDARNAFQDGETFSELLVPGDAGCDFFLDGGDLSVDLLAALSIVLLQKL
jgi:hypothetical protein